MSAVEAGMRMSRNRYLGHTACAKGGIYGITRKRNERTMERKKFTGAKMTELRKNPHTYKITQGRLRFTVEFKALFGRRGNDGEGAVEILRSCGYAPEMLGANRINGIRMHI